MKISFIRPNLADYRSKDAMQPLAFAILSGLTPSYIERDFYDEKIEPVPLSLNSDLIALSVESFTAKRAYQLADHYRKRGATVGMGGYHPTLMPDEAKEYADAIVVGEAEKVWPQLLADFQNNCLKKVYTQSEASDLRGLYFDRSIFIGKKYMPLFPVQFSRGCRYACDFCSVSEFYHYQRSHRPVEDVLLEIEGLAKENILLGDDNIFADKDSLKTLMKGMIPLKVRWACQASIDIALHDDLLSLMAESGCFAVLIGFESLDNLNLKQMNKQANLKSTDYEKTIKKLQQHGIMVYGSFVFGYDNDSQDIFDRTLEFAIKNRLFLCNFNVLMPLPGTKLYQRYLNDGRLINKQWWLSGDFRYNDTVYLPVKLTAKQLTDGSWNTRYKFYQWRNIFIRWLSIGASKYRFRNSWIFVLANYIAQKEVIRKHKMFLGAKS